jgi:hypothetical protein
VNELHLISGKLIQPCEYQAFRIKNRTYYRRLRSRTSKTHEEHPQAQRVASTSSGSASRVRSSKSDSATNGDADAVHQRSPHSNTRRQRSVAASRVQVQSCYPSITHFIRFVYGRSDGLTELLAEGAIDRCVVYVAIARCNDRRVNSDLERKRTRTTVLRMNHPNMSLRRK